jgi:hypothetical protein
MACQCSKQTGELKQRCLQQTGSSRSCWLLVLLSAVSASILYGTLPAGQQQGYCCTAAIQVPHRLIVLLSFGLACACTSSDSELPVPAALPNQCRCCTTRRALLAAA